MIKYIIVACLCLMLTLDQAESQNQEKTMTDKRVERDIDMDQMSQESDFPSQFADVGNTFSERFKNVMDIVNVFVQQAKNLMQRFSTFE